MLRQRRIRSSLHSTTNTAFALLQHYDAQLCLAHTYHTGRQHSKPANATAHRTNHHNRNNDNNNSTTNNNNHSPFPSLYNAFANIDRASRQPPPPPQQHINKQSVVQLTGGGVKPTMATTGMSMVDRIKAMAARKQHERHWMRSAPLNPNADPSSISGSLPLGYDTFNDLLDYAGTIYSSHSAARSSTLDNTRQYRSIFEARSQFAPADMASMNKTVDQLLQEAVDKAPASIHQAALITALRAGPRNQHNSRKPARRPNNWDQRAQRNAQNNNVKFDQVRQQQANRAAVNGQTAQQIQEKVQKKQAIAETRAKQIHINARQTVARLSQVMKLPTSAILRHLSELGHKARAATDYVDADAADVVVRECGFEPVKQQSALEQARNKTAGGTDAQLPRRGPVVCVAGHVDHGKTTLLDALRLSNIAAGEAGGITQAIGAFRVDLSLNGVDSDMSQEDRLASVATFLDTPGHAAFKNMRERGISSSCVDMLVLVVSAVDGIQPQTIEAIRLATTNNVPIVVAINKCDLYGADSTNIQLELLKFDVVTETHGGDVQCCDISALKRTGLDTLKEALLLTAEMSDLRSSRTAPAQCYVVESKVERGTGIALNVVVRSGELKVGDIVVSGTQYAKIRALIGEGNQRVQSAGPSVGVQLLGFESLEGTESECIAVADEATAQSIVEDRIRASEAESADVHDVDVDENGINTVNDTKRFRQKRGRKMIVGARVLTPEEQKAEDLKQETTLNLFVKSDVGGSLEAMLSYISMLPMCSTEVTAEVVKSGLGEVTEHDLLMAQETNASIVAFNMPLTAKVEAMVKNMKLNVISDSIIYNVMDSIAGQLSDKLPPLVQKHTAGTVDVAAVFDIRSKKGQAVRVAGCKVATGEISIKHRVRVIRDEQVLVENGIIESLKHFKDEVSSVKKDDECGLLVRGFTDWQTGDTIECVATTVTPRTFNDTLARGGVPNKSNEQQFGDRVYKAKQFA